jgi:acid phosphatase
MGRHGSRLPTKGNWDAVQDLVAKLESASDAIAKAELPHNLKFLKDGYTFKSGHDSLTAPGRAELFKHGVEYVISWDATSI